MSITVRVEHDQQTNVEVRVRRAGWQQFINY